MFICMVAKLVFYRDGVIVRQRIFRDPTLNGALYCVEYVLVVLVLSLREEGPVGANKAYGVSYVST